MLRINKIIVSITMRFPLNSIRSTHPIENASFLPSRIIKRWLTSHQSEHWMLEILRQAQRFNLIRFESAQPFEQTRIEVLKTLPRVIQFNELAEWTRTANLHKNPQTASIEAGEGVGEEEETEL